MWRGEGSSARSAKQLYEEALRIDPNFAAAHAGLASCLVTFAILGAPDAKGLLTHARNLGKRVVELDPNRAEGYTFIADGYQFLDRDWAAAEASHRRAMRLNPTNFEVCLGYAVRFFGLSGRVDEGITELNERERSPGSAGEAVGI